MSGLAPGDLVETIAVAGVTYWNHGRPGLVGVVLEVPIFDYRWPGRTFASVRMDDHTGDYTVRGLRKIQGPPADDDEVDLIFAGSRAWKEMAR